MAEPSREVVFRIDHVNEQVVLAAAIVGLGFRKDATVRLPTDVFLTEEHRAAWGALREAQRRGLGSDPATLNGLANGELDVAYLAELATARPDVPDEKTLAFHVEQLLWDRQRYVAMTGPVAGLLDALTKNEAPDRVRAQARSVAESFAGWSERQYLREPAELIRQQVLDIRERMAGRAVFPFGIPGLDLYDAAAASGGPIRPRMVPGVAPGLVTVVTGVPGSGKSTFTARVALGLARQKRKVLYGAWEMTGGVTLELLAIMSLGWSRSAIAYGELDEAKLATLRERMEAISAYVTFMENPFRRRGVRRTSNEQNLELIQGYVADSNCDVFIADLWKRCLRKTDPEEEEEALIHQQAIAEDTRVHVIMVQQQRLKDVESRPDKRPTREGIKGSGAWVEVPDNILGIHRPALWKAVPDNVLEVDVLKQRYAKWPLAIEFDWDAERGMVSGGRSIEYDAPGSRTEMSEVDKKIFGGGKGRR